jgi:hypothetical protein
MESRPKRGHPGSNDDAVGAAAGHAVTQSLKDDMVMATRGTRRLAAGALLAGGLAIFLSSFLPLGKDSFPANSDSPELTVITVPARDLITTLQFNVQNPDNSSLASTLFWAFLVWGIPLVLLALGGAELAARRSWASVASCFASLLLLLVGAGYSLVSLEFYLYPIFGTEGGTRTLEYGSIVTLIGYLSAFGAIIWLWWLSRRTRSER